MGEPENRLKSERVPKEAKPSPIVLGFFHVLTTIADRFGTAAALLVGLFLVVWGMGSDKTEDDFIRELLFGEINDGPGLRLFVVLLVILAIVPVGLIRKRLGGESAEMKRIAAEKSRLQEKVLGVDLAHTEDHVSLEEASK